MDHVLSLPEIVSQIVSYAHINTILRFGTTNKFNNKIVNTYINNINEDNFLLDNNIRVHNKSYEFYCNIKFDIRKLQSMPDFRIRIKDKRKHAYIKYIIDKTTPCGGPSGKIFISINQHMNMTRFTISGCKTTIDTHVEIGKLLNLLLINNYIDHIPTYKLIPVAVSATFVSDFTIPNNLQFTRVHTNRRHVYNTCDKLIINSHKGHVTYNKYNKFIGVHYNNFKIFYITYSKFAL